MYIHNSCGHEVTTDREFISEGDTDEYPESEYGYYYFAACLHCDEDLLKFEITQAVIR